MDEDLSAEGVQEKGLEEEEDNTLPAATESHRISILGGEPNGIMLHFQLTTYQVLRARGK